MLINLRNALMTGKRLPYDAEVEYLEFSNGAYINTGIVPTGMFTLSMTSSFTDSAPSQSTMFSADANAFILRKNSQDIQFNGNGFWREISTLNDTNAHTYRIESADGTQWMYSVDGGSSAVGSISLGDLSNLSSLLLGWRYVYTSQYGGLRLHHFSYGSALDLIPVRKGTVGYLYDRVSGKLFGNAGTGDFVLGPDVVPVEYIESHGTEYIDTGVNAKQSLKIRAVFETNSARSAFAYGVRAGNTTITCASGFGTALGFARWGDSAYASAVPEGLVDVTQDSGGVIVNGTSYPYNAAQTVVEQSGYTMVLFAGRNSTTTVTANLVSKFNSCKIWDNNSHIRSFLPVRVGTEGAMMDVLTRRIYRNQGTGAFAYGNDLRYPIPAA